MSCGICNSTSDPDRRRVIDKMLASEHSFSRIEAECKSLGFAVKRETVAKHYRTCLLLGGERPKDEAVLAAAAAASGSTADFAKLVRAEAVRKLQAGELRVTTADGLQAQALIDRREEKKKDRDLITRLGLLLAGGGGGETLPPMIEGEYVEVPQPEQVLIEASLGSGD